MMLGIESVFYCVVESSAGQEEVSSHHMNGGLPGPSAKTVNDHTFTGFAGQLPIDFSWIVYCCYHTVVATILHVHSA